MNTSITLDQVHPFQQFTPIEVGRLLRLHADTVKKLAAKGELEGIRCTDKGFWRFSAAQIQRYIDKLTTQVASAR